MNDVLQQLIALSPGLVQGARGKGHAMQAFMESFQKTQAALDQQARVKQGDQISLQDRQRAIERQTEQDRIAAEQRTHAGVQQQQADALQRLQIPGSLAELGGTAETPEDAKHLIETALPSLMSAFGQDTMAFGQPAVEMAQRTITSRQKRQVSEFVSKALNTSFVADNPDADPEITNLPEHVQKALGKPQAKLSELQAFAELPVGKPQGKTRVPPAAGSMEEYSDPATTPARKRQIEADRKRYMQSDDRPPAGTDPEIAAMRKDLLRMQVERAGEVKDPNQAQYTSAGYVGRMEQSEPILAKLAPTITTMSLPSFKLQTDSWFAKPTFQSPEVQSYMQASRNFINAVLRRESGAVISPSEFAEARQQYLPVSGDTEETLAQKAANRAYVFQNMKRSSGRAYEPPVTPPAAGGGGGPKPGERRKIKGQLAEWDGKGWLPVKP